MPNRAFVILISAVAALAWVGLVAFMNLRPPTLSNQLLFLLLWASAVACTAMPLSYVFNARVAPLGPERDMTRAARQGLLLGLLAAVLMLLRFMRLLSLFNGVVLALVVMLVEVLVYLKMR